MLLIGECLRSWKRETTSYGGAESATTKTRSVIDFKGISHCCSEKELAVWQSGNIVALLRRVLISLWKNYSRAAILLYQRSDDVLAEIEVHQDEL